MRTIWMTALAALALAASARADALPTLLVGQWEVALGEITADSSSDTSYPDSAPNVAQAEDPTFRGQKVGHSVIFKIDVFAENAVHLLPGAGVSTERLKAVEVLTFRAGGVFIRTIVFPGSKKPAFYAKGRWIYRGGKLNATYHYPFQVPYDGYESFSLNLTLTPRRVIGSRQARYPHAGPPDPSHIFQSVYYATYNLERPRN